ncbi:MAG: hypothetical protein M5U11_00415 [Anaerolineales bacterium]|nr:hypothetical protein [Anaerolineales bacterium]
MKSNFEFPSKDIPSDLVIETSHPRYYPVAEDSLEFHAARILLLLKYAGGKQAKISGRLKLAKLDFFVRYPSYLSKAIGSDSKITTYIQPESPMIRYKYGPWDNKYYDVFALLVAKGLMAISSTKSGDEFSLTDRGQNAVTELQGPDFEEIIFRCQLAYQRFKDFSGSQLKNFIYENFPEIVAQPISSEI